ncbi:MAG: T9SS type A sorting domain-containing protein, partial [Ignavibacteriaceae bacterium]|nr:T9SS type A sorting domain-containing protein [Ignavibacteriaceae bacterium]
FDGSFSYSKVVEIDLNKVFTYTLNQNYPNPFNPSTTINFSLAKAGNVKLTVYNLLGQEVKSLMNGVMEAGNHTVPFDASNLNSGVYLYKIESGSFVQVRKMTLMK